MRRCGQGFRWGHARSSRADTALHLQGQGEGASWDPEAGSPLGRGVPRRAATIMGAQPALRTPWRVPESSHLTSFLPPPSISCTEPSQKPRLPTDTACLVSFCLSGGSSEWLTDNRNLFPQSGGWKSGISLVNPLLGQTASLSLYPHMTERARVGFFIPL